MSEATGKGDQATSIEGSVLAFEGDIATLRVTAAQCFTEVNVPLSYLPNESRRVGAAITMTFIKDRGHLRPHIKARAAKIDMTSEELDILNWAFL